jgi:hypothetical protein
LALLTHNSTEKNMAKVLCVLYPDPTTGYPPKYARDDIPVITGYPNGQTAPSPKGELGSHLVNWDPQRSIAIDRKVAPSAAVLFVGGISQFRLLGRLQRVA